MFQLTRLGPRAAVAEPATADQPQRAADMSSWLTTVVGPLCTVAAKAVDITAEQVLDISAALEALNMVEAVMAINTRLRGKVMLQPCDRNRKSTSGWLVL